MGHSGPDFIVEEVKNPDFESFLENSIRSMNNAVSPYHRLSRKPGALRPLNIILRGADGEIIGGLAALTYWGWLDIENFFLPESLRGRGTGSHILAAAEDAARCRGCTAAHLTTYSFQARTFYEKHGWNVVGELKDYPPGSSYYWMRKDL